jgi:hypothetical protein
MPDFYLAYRANLQCTENGLDSLDHCLDKLHFNLYPHQINYVYNSRGYRDREWPDDLANSIWCFGDSFTVGIGSPIEHIWPSILENRIGHRCINVSLDGGSNDWIVRKVLRVLEEVKPRLIVIQWTYLHRNESSETSIDDESRRVFAGKDLLTENLVRRFIDNIRQVELHKGNTTVIHSMIPNAGPVNLLKEYDALWSSLRGSDWPNKCPRDINQLTDIVAKELKETKRYDEFVDSILFTNAIDSVPNFVHYRQQDLARDGLHYDLLTATDFVNRVINCAESVSSSVAAWLSTSNAKS